MFCSSVGLSFIAAPFDLLLRDGARRRSPQLLAFEVHSECLAGQLCRHPALGATGQFFDNRGYSITFAMRQPFKLRGCGGIDKERQAFFAAIDAEMAFTVVGLFSALVRAMDVIPMRCQ
jgi:hypothetical protein